MKKTVLFFSLLIMFSCWYKQECNLSEEILLSGNWEVQSSVVVSAKGDEISSPHFQAKDWYKAEPISGILTGKIELNRFSIPVQLNPKEKKQITLTSDDVASLHVENPRFCWCNGLGKPELYENESECLKPKRLYG